MKKVSKQAYEQFNNLFFKNNKRNKPYRNDDSNNENFNNLSQKLEESLINPEKVIQTLNLVYGIDYNLQNTNEFSNMKHNEIEEMK